MEQNGRIEEVMLYGLVEPYFETGTEGVYWAVEQTDENGNYLNSYDGLNIIKDGDHLTIWDHDGSPLFQGEIIYDKKTGYQPYPLNPQYGQQVSCGAWVHWIQKGWEPDAWGKLFFDQPHRKARLITRKWLKNEDSSSQ